MAGIGAEILLSSSVDEFRAKGLDTQIAIENLAIDADKLIVNDIISQIDIGDISAASSDSTTVSSLSIQIVLEEV